MGQRKQRRRKPILNWCLAGFALAAMTLDSGCAKHRLRRKPAPALQASMTPPTIEGSEVRSQDAGKLTRRVNPKTSVGSQTPGQATAKAPAAIANRESAPKPSPTGDTPSLIQEPEEAVIAASVAQELSSKRTKQVDPIPDPPDLPRDRQPVALPAIASPGDASRGVSEDVLPIESASTVAPPTSAEALAQGTSARLSATSPAEPRDPATDSAVIRSLIDQAKNRLGQTTSYQTRLRRQERVGQNLQPAEEVILSIRREPIAVRLEWPAGPNKGREVIYSPVETGGKMQIFQPNSLMPRMTLNPDSPLVLKNSRHPITEAGFDNLLGNLDRSLGKAQAGNPGSNKMSYQAPVVIPEIERACHQITEVRPDGETWLVCLDAETLMPAMIRGTAPDGALLELYLFQDLQLNVAELATETAFLPDARWGKGGILSRLAKSASETPESAETTTR